MSEISGMHTSLLSQLPVKFWKLWSIAPVLAWILIWPLQPWFAPADAPGCRPVKKYATRDPYNLEDWCKK